MSKIIDNFTAMLQARADQNGDGKLTAQDVTILARRAKEQLVTETEKFPTAMLIVAFAVGALLGFFVGRL